MYGKPHLVERFLRVFIATKTLLANHLLHCSCSHLCMHPLYANSWEMTLVLPNTGGGTRAQRSGSRSGPLCCSKATTAMLGRKLLPNCRHGGERTCWASRSVAPSSSSSSSRSCSYRSEITHCFAPAGSCWCAMARAKARPAAGGGARAWQAWAEERRGADERGSSSTDGRGSSKLSEWGGRR